MRKLTTTTIALLLVASSLLAGGPTNRRALSAGVGRINAVASSTPAAPDAPVLTVAGVTTDTISLTCTTPSGATSYEWDISEGSDFATSRAVLTATTTTAAALALTGQPAGNTLWARVRAVGAGGTSGNSSAASGTLVDRRLGCAATSVLILGNQAANYSAWNGAEARWRDMSGGGFDAVQATASANAPAASGSALYFDGGDYLVLAAPPSATTSWTIIGRVLKGPGNRSELLSGNTGTTMNWTAWPADQFIAGGGRSYFNAGGAWLTPNVTSTTGVQQVFAWSQDASSTVHFWLDGAFQAAVAGTARTLNAYPAWFVGAAYSGGTLSACTNNLFRVEVTAPALSAAELASTPLWLDAPPRGPTLNAITASTTTTLVASWTHLPGTYGYRCDVSTSSTFVAGGYIPGYQSAIVATSSAGALTIDVTGYTGQTVYIRMRSAGAGGIGPNSTTTTAVVP